MQIKINCEFEKMLSIAALKPHPKNRNKHPQEQIERLARLLEYQGWRHPIVVSLASDCIVAGHGRLEAAKLLGLTEVPVDFQEFASEEQEYSFIQSDNAIAAWAELDLSGINSDLPDLGPDLNLDMLGIKSFVLEPMDKLELPKSEKSDGQKQYRIEVKFPNDMEMMDIHDDLVSRGYIVRVL